LSSLACGNGAISACLSTPFTLPQLPLSCGTGWAARQPLSGGDTDKGLVGQGTMRRRSKVYWGKGHRARGGGLGLLEGHRGGTAATDLWEIRLCSSSAGGEIIYLQPYFLPRALRKNGRGYCSPLNPASLPPFHFIQLQRMS